MSYLNSSQIHLRLVYCIFGIIFSPPKKGSTPVDEYILKMRCLADALIAAGQSFTDDELVLYILGGLGPEYESVVVNLAARDSVTLTELQFSLQIHEMWLAQQNSTGTLDLQNPSSQYASSGYVLLRVSILIQEVEVLSTGAVAVTTQNP